MLKKRNSTRSGLLIDIGSGSVGMAIVRSDENKSAPEIIWQRREYANIASNEEGGSSRSIMSLLKNLTKKAQEVLQTAPESSKMDPVAETQITLSAPWAHAVSRPVVYKQPEAFVITPELLAKLGHLASEEDKQNLTNLRPELSTELDITDSYISNLNAEGYPIDQIDGQLTPSINFLQTTTVADRSMLETARKIQSDIFFNVPNRNTSSLLGLMAAIKKVHPLATDFCLLDITDHTTQLGIVRQGSLEYCNHNHYGSASIAKEIARLNNRPFQEVYQDLIRFISAGKKNDNPSVLDKYTKQLFELFPIAKNNVFTPKTVYFLANKSMSTVMPRLTEQLGTLLKKPNIELIDATKLFPKKIKSTDHGLTTAAIFFHTED